MRILVVDDSPTMRDITSATLSAAKHQVVQADHGAEGLEMLDKEPVDLIITDLNMYVMGGLEFVTRVREMPEHEFTPILFLTTEGSDEFKAIGREAGATGWMVKPFDPKELLRVVNTITQ